MYDPPLSRLITGSVSRLTAEMEAAAPFMARQVSTWLQQLSGSVRPEDYFKHPLAFPSLLLPWWAEKTMSQQPDLALQSDLVYSTINGYYYIRLIDNLMDGNATVELKLLPALNFFHTQFQLAYQRHFAADHPFWQLFTATWFHSGEVAMQDAALTDIDEIRFKQIAAQKVSAAKIPLAAVCYRYDRPDLIAPWAQFVDLFGGWHQMHNDLFDWHRDEARQNYTYFLCEGRRQQKPDEPLAGWVARAGFQWAMDTLQQWLADSKQLAVELGSPALLAYLSGREELLLNQKEKVAAGLQSLARIAALHQA